MPVVVVVVLGYMFLLLGLAIASPGIGVTGRLLTLVPDNWRDLAHVPAYGLLAWLAIQGFRLRGWPLPYALVCGILLTTVFGVWTEVAQGSAAGRETSLHDVLNDALGGMIAATLAWWQCALSRPTVCLMRAPGPRSPRKGSLS